MVRALRVVARLDTIARANAAISKARSQIVEAAARLKEAQSSLARAEPFDDFSNVTIGQPDVTMATLRFDRHQTGVKQRVDMLADRRW